MARWNSSVPPPACLPAINEPHHEIYLPKLSSLNTVLSSANIESNVRAAPFRSSMSTRSWFKHQRFKYKPIMKTERAKHTKGTLVRATGREYKNSPDSRRGFKGSERLQLKCPLGMSARVFITKPRDINIKFCNGYTSLMIQDNTLSIFHKMTLKCER